MTPVLIFALELVVLYSCGTYAMSRMATWGFNSGIGKVTFYFLVLPGVALHESAHYLACLLTGTRVERFAPFLPRNLPDGRLRLGYIRHEKRSAPIKALIGLAPVVVNPVGVMVVTVLLTTTYSNGGPQSATGGFRGASPVERISNGESRRCRRLGLSGLQLRAWERAEPGGSFLGAGGASRIRYGSLRLELLSGRLGGSPALGPHRTLRPGGGYLCSASNSRRYGRPPVRFLETCRFTSIDNASFCALTPGYTCCKNITYYLVLALLSPLLRTYYSDEHQASKKEPHSAYGLSHR